MHAMGRVSDLRKPTVTHVRGHEVVPESVLRRRKTLAEVKEKREEILAAQRVKRSNKPAAGVLFKKAAAFVKDYRQKFASGTRLARESKKLRRIGTTDVEAKLVLVIRHKAGKNLDSKTKKILHVLKLYEMHTAAFVKATPATTKMLHLASPGIVFGEPSLKTVRDLIQKRGFATVQKKRVALTDNRVIEEQLGNKGMVCLEDLINEIHTVGPNFREANQLLLPFKLNPPRTRIKRDHSKDKEVQEDVNELIERMN